jgi:hypothetical protein
MPDFDPDAWLKQRRDQRTSQPPATSAPFDPDAWLADRRQSQQPGMVTDIGRSVEAGAIRAPLHVPGALGDFANIGESISEVPSRITDWALGTHLTDRQRQRHEDAERMGAALPSTMSIARGVEERTGLPASYVGRTLPGRVAGGAVETALDPISLASGGGSAAARLGVGATSGAAGEIGSEVAGPIGGMAAGGLTGLLHESGLARTAQRAANRARRQPTADEIRMAGSVAATGRRNAWGDLAAADAADRLNQAMDRATRYAQVHGGSSATHLKAELNRIIEDGSMPQYEAALRHIVGSDQLLNAATRAGRHGHFPLWGLVTGHFGEALGAEGGRYAAQGLANRRAMGRTQDIRDAILRGAPSGGGPPPPVPPWFRPDNLPGAAIRATQSTGQGQQPWGQNVSLTTPAAAAEAPPAQTTTRRQPLRVDVAPPTAQQNRLADQTEAEWRSERTPAPAP